jgi:hypothetical protein
VRLKEAYTWSRGLEEAEIKEVAPDADQIRSDQIWRSWGKLEFKHLPYWGGGEVLTLAPSVQPLPAQRNQNSLPE